MSVEHPERPERPRPRRLSTEIEAQLARRDVECAAQAASIDDLSERLAALGKLIESSDAIPEEIDEEDSLVVHVEEARSSAG
jgi:hypothetical protein